MSHLEPIVLLEIQSGVATLTLNRPQARNALSTELMIDLEKGLAAIARDSAIKVVVLAANGPAFCAGHDVREMAGLDGRDQVAALFAQCAKVMTAIVRLPQPVIAKVHGMASAAGCQLVASCDLAYASTEARFATPGVNIGLFCSTPMVPLSRNVSSKHAMEMLLCGQPINAQTAEAYGLINRAFSPEQLGAEVQMVAETIAAKSGYVVKVGKAAFHHQREMGLDEAYAYASDVMTANMLAADAAEGLSAFLEKRSPIWRGC
ncbi:MAG: enoyl-CoA hydratase [Rhodospirillaceae bacterium]|nr:enoyl-CoA hydratase [Rhodospirillales bacterium]